MRCGRRRCCSSSAVMHEDRSILDFIDGRFTFVNGPLARLLRNQGRRRRRVPARRTATASERSGIVTQGSILTHLVVRDADLAGAARQMGARQSAGHAAASAAGGHTGARRDEPRDGGLDAAAAGAASGESGLRARATTRWTRSGSAWRTTMRPADGGRKDGNFDDRQRGDAAGRPDVRRARRA